MKPSHLICIGANPPIGGSVTAVSVERTLEIGEEAEAIIGMDVTQEKVAIAGNGDVMDPENSRGVRTPGEERLSAGRVNKDEHLPV